VVVRRWTKMGRIVYIVVRMLIEVGMRRVHVAVIRLTGHEDGSAPIKEMAAVFSLPSWLQVPEGIPHQERSKEDTSFSHSKK
jgi:hypothetical protein